MIDGSVSSDGLPGQQTFTSGGGAGGAILINTARIHGYGLITAHGGLAYHYFTANNIIYGRL